MQITKGKIQKAQKVVIYGPEGIGKTSLAAQFPDPLFIDTEGGTNQLDIARFDKPTSWQMLAQQIQYVIVNKPCKTLVIDTVDWAERLCTESICAQHGKAGVEDFGYGNGYTYVAEEFGRFLNKLSEVVDAGINVVLTAHSQIKKFEQPDEMGAYDRYELKLGKKTSSQTAPLTKEWADMVLFANYKTISVAVDDKGKKHKAQGGKRVIYTEHHPAWDAKNRHGLPAEIEMDYIQIAHVIPTIVAETNTSESVVKEKLTTETESTISKSETVQTAETNKSEVQTLPGSIPKGLSDLMQEFNVTVDNLRDYAFNVGHFPADTPIENYPTDYFNMVIANWEKVIEKIAEIKKGNDALPF